MIEKIQRKKSISYRARVSLPNAQRLSKTFKRRVDAEKWERQILYQVQTGMLHGSRLTTRLNFSELVGEWYHKKVKVLKGPRTVTNYQSDVRTHLLPLFGQTPIQKIQRSSGDYLVDVMKQRGSSHRTINKILTRFKQILNYAVDEQYLAVNPLNRYPSLKEPPKQDVVLTEKEIQQLLAKTNQLF